MKLDSKALRYLANDDWRVLMAAESGSKNHEVVPTVLLQRISGLRGAGAVNRCISNLAKIGLIAKVQNAKYDGYRLTYGGLDYLALHQFVKRNSVYSVGNQIGVGKESDIYVVADETGAQRVMKIHRLGRISFRAVKNQRDYLRKKGSHATWMDMSCLAAAKEYAFMNILRDNGFPVPMPIDQARHCIIMELVDAFPLRQISFLKDVAKLYRKLMELILKFGSMGLIHGDFNEFNILVHEDTEEPIVIDFPQMISILHRNAEEQFDRDVQCIKIFFERHFRYTCDDEGPRFSDIVRVGTLDADVKASGFTKKQLKELEKYMEDVGANAPEGSDDDEEETDEDEEDEDESDDDVSPKDNDDDVAARSDGEKDAVPKKA